MDGRLWLTVAFAANYSVAVTLPVYAALVGLCQVFHSYGDPLLSRGKDPSQHAQDQTQPRPRNNKVERNKHVAKIRHTACLNRTGDMLHTINLSTLNPILGILCCLFVPFSHLLLSPPHFPQTVTSSNSLLSFFSPNTHSLLSRAGRRGSC